MQDARFMVLQNQIDNISREMRCREILIGGTEVNFSNVEPRNLVPEVIQFVKEKFDVQIQKEDIDKIFANQMDLLQSLLYPVSLDLHFRSWQTMPIMRITPLCLSQLNIITQER